MRKFIYFLIFLFLLSLGINKVNAKVDDDIKTIDLKPDNLKAIEKDVYAYEYDNTVTLRINEIDINLGCGKLVKATSNNEYYFILVSCNLVYRIDKQNNKINKYEFNDLYFNDFLVDDSFIYLAGKSSNNAVVNKYSMDFILTKSFKMNGSGASVVLSIQKSSNSIFLNIYQDAVLNDDRFYNLGNINEKKSVLIKLNTDLEYDNIYYFNHHCESEIIESFIIQNDHLVVLLNCSNNFYLYDFDYNLYVYNYFTINEDNIIGLVESKIENTYLCLAIQDKKLILYDIFKDSKNLIYEVSDIDDLFDYLIIDGKLTLYYYSTNFLYCNSLREYVIKDNNDLVFNRLYYPDTINHLRVESYFENIKCSIDNNYSEKMIDGKYVDSTKLEFEDGDYINITSNRIVMPYTNFYDGGIYKTGKVLEFFGHCYLNDELIYFGKTLNVEGKYTIRLVDYNGKESIYNITIDDSFYKNETICNIEPDIVCNINESPIINYILNDDSIKVTGLIINGAVSYNFTQDKTSLMIKLPSSEIYGTKSFAIEKIYYESNGIESYALVNDLYTINYLKEEPIINVEKNIDKNMVNLSFDITDNNQAFEYIKVKLFSDSSLKEEKILLNTDSFDFNNYPSSIIKFYFVYNLSNSLEEYELASFALIDSQYLGKVSLNYNGGKITKIEIEESLPTDQTKIKKIGVGSSDILSYYEQYDEYNIGKKIIIITIIFSVIVVSLYFGVKLIKRLKSN